MMTPSTAWLQKLRRRFHAITTDLDSGVGKLLSHVERLGLTDRTYIIYMSDNGGGGGKGKSKLFNAATMTYASEYFSWTAGNIEADTYFCPERHGTYFGGFYMKDMPAMGKRDFDISTAVTGDSGAAFIEQVLTEEQRRPILAIVDKQKSVLQETIKVRRKISRELRKFLTNDKPDQTKLMALGRHYGELDGEMSWYDATAFAVVNKTLTADQRASLVKLRNLDGYTSASYYIYSQAMTDEPDLTNVDTFFK